MNRATGSQNMIIAGIFWGFVLFFVFKIFDQPPYWMSFCGGATVFLFAFLFRRVAQRSIYIEEDTLVITGEKDVIRLQKDSIQFYEISKICAYELRISLKDGETVSIPIDGFFSEGKIKDIFGTLGIEPLLPAFWHRYPDIMIDLSLSDDIVDLYLDRTDIAFRIGNLPDSSLTAHNLGTARRVIVAAPAYLARRGVPVAFGDLADHDCLGFNFRRTITSWPIADSGRTVERVSRPCLERG